MSNLAERFASPLDGKNESSGFGAGTVDDVPSGRPVDGDPNTLTEIGILLGDTDAVDYDFAEALPARISCTRGICAGQTQAQQPHSTQAVM